MKIGDTLWNTFMARIAVVHVVGYDEGHLIRELSAMTKRPGWPQDMGLYTWDAGDQFVGVTEAKVHFDVSQKASPDNLLTMLDDFKGSAAFVLKDAHMFWSQKKSFVRKLRNLAQRWSSTSPQKFLILTTPDWGSEFALPAELRHDIVSVECPKPDKEELDAILARVSGQSGALMGVRPELRAMVRESALGLSAVQAERVFRKAIMGGKSGKLDEGCLDSIREEKRAIIRESGALELCSYAETQDSVGGLEVLKLWLHQRKEAYGEAAREYGLDLPSGLMLVGIPGTGKSLCAKVTASAWKLPLLRLDMGAVFAGILGSSEKNIREAIAISELIAPCILWVDEIEKAFGGGEGSTDGGTSRRVLATFLTWMAEKTHPVFVFATANDVFRLPTEFTRKGRFDEVFFLDLPTEEERRAILAVHLRKRGYQMIERKFDLAAVAKATEGFVGAELEAVVKDAMFPAFMDKQRELETADLVKSAGQMVPLAKSHAKQVEALRSLVSDGLARNASRAKIQEAVACEKIRGGRLLDV
jgi:hypothetical protein